MKKIYALTDSRTNEDIIRSLENNGFVPIKLPCFDKLPEPVSAHPDMLVFAVSGKLFTYKQYYEENKNIFSSLLCGCDIILCDDPKSTEYPYDVGMNAFICGGMLFSNTPYTASAICSLPEYRHIKVKQGYAACSCIVLDRALITADKSIYEAAVHSGIDALCISEGFVSLPPYKYGFIGGACGVFENTVYFAGNIRNHPDFQAISDFLSGHGYMAVSLTDSPLKDIGKIIFFA